MLKVNMTQATELGEAEVFIAPFLILLVSLSLSIFYYSADFRKFSKSENEF